MELSLSFSSSNTNIVWFSLPYRSTYARASDIANALGSANIDVVGRWNPALTAAACVLFGAADAFQLSVQALGVGIPSEIFVMLPYILTVAALATYHVDRSRAFAYAVVLHGINFFPFVVAGLVLLGGRRGWLRSGRTVTEPGEDVVPARGERL